MIALGPDQVDHLMLHSNVLKAASPFFDVGLNAQWTKGVGDKTVSDPTTGKEVHLFNYQLLFHDGIFSLHVKVGR